MGVVCGVLQWLGRVRRGGVYGRREPAERDGHGEQWLDSLSNLFALVANMLSLFGDHGPVSQYSGVIKFVPLVKKVRWTRTLPVVPFGSSMKFLNSFSANFFKVSLK